MLINSKNALHDDVNKLKHENEELKTDLNEIVKHQDVIKIIQTEHEEKISQLTLLVLTFETTIKEFITTKQEQFEKSIQTHIQNMNIFQEAVKETQSEINDKITLKGQEFEQINKYVKKLNNRIDILQNQSDKITQEEINKIKKKSKVLKDKIDQLERDIGQMKLPGTKKPNLSSYEEKLAPRDLFELDWSKYQQTNQANISN